jgi:hypothetical protein
MSDQLPVIGAGSRGDVVPATVSGDLTTRPGDSGSLPPAVLTPASSPDSEPLVSRLNQLAAHLRLSDQQLQAYRTWAAHSQEQLHGELEAWAIKNQEAQDEADHAECARVLRAEWGTSYETNVARIKVFLAAEPAAVRKVYMEGRYDSGSWVANDPGVLRALLAKAVGSSALPNAGSGVDVEKRIGEIEALMANTSSEYWKGPRAEAIQAEYRGLLGQRELRRS